MLVSCGEALVDLVPDPVPGGGPMNVAVAAARLGLPTAFAGCVSTDDHGQTITAHLETNGVDLALLQSTDQPTARAIVEHTPELVFRFEGDNTADTLLGPVDLDALAWPAQIIHGGTLGLFRGRTADTLAELAEAHDGLVSLDPNVRPQIIDDRAAWDRFHQRWVEVTGLYKASDEDLAWIWPDQSVEACVDHLLERGVAAVVVTRGANGLSVATGSGTVTVPSPAVDVVDTVGAGDTVVAAILANLSERAATTAAAVGELRLDQWQGIAAAAAEAAAVTVTRPGADPPRREDLSW